MKKHNDEIVVSIITVVYNNERHICDAINSVLSQDYRHIEYIVIDGCSNDNTFDIVSKYKDQISVIVSEPDCGIYDALNKGISRSSGDVIGFLNSDDFFANQLVVSDIVRAFDSSSADVVYGDLDYISLRTGNVIRHWKSGIFSINKLKYGWMPPHPSFYVKRHIYTAHNKTFNLSYRISSDYDSMLRVLNSDNVKVFYLSKVLVKMRLGGVSNKNLSSIFLKIQEDYSILKSNNIGGITALLFKNCRKLPQFISGLLR
jgi:glycosyltransferase